MEGICWLWLYDKRWLFGFKQPSLMKVWSAPLLQNALFLTITLYYALYQPDECYQSFKSWLDIRLYMLTLLIIGILWILLETLSSRNKENEAMKPYKKANPSLTKKHNYWLRRKVLLSFPGVIVLLLGFINWGWTVVGLQQVYNGYNDNYSQCKVFLHDVMWGNLLLTTAFALPVIWVLFWMVFIKAMCLIMGLVCPSVLIAIKKCFM